MVFTCGAWLDLVELGRKELLTVEGKLALITNGPSQVCRHPTRKHLDIPLARDLAAFVQGEFTHARPAVTRNLNVDDLRDGRKQLRQPGNGCVEMSRLDVGLARVAVAE